MPKGSTDMIAVFTRWRYLVAPVLAAVDRVQISQVFVKLIKNAAEALSETATDDKAIALEVAVGEGQDLVTVSVVDNDAGLSAKLAGRLFQPFLTTKPEGLGLGLSISRSIVQAHGGVLIVERSAIGKGTGARFTLPVAAPL